MNPSEWQSGASLAKCLGLPESGTKKVAYAAEHGSRLCARLIERRQATDDDRRRLGLHHRTKWVYRYRKVGEGRPRLEAAGLDSLNLLDPTLDDRVVALERTVAGLKDTVEELQLRLQETTADLRADIASLDVDVEQLKSGVS